MDKSIINERDLYAMFSVTNRQEFLNSLEAYDKAVAPEMRAAGYRCKNQAKRTVLFTFGEVTFSRRRWYRGTECRVPVDEKLGLDKNSRYSQELLYQIAELATRAPYRKVAEIIELMYQIYISKDTVLKVMKRARSLLRAKDEYRFYQDKQGIKKLKVAIIYIEGDGVMVKAGQREGGRFVDLSHFVIHAGSKEGRLLHKKEVVSISNHVARSQVLDYIYNHLEIGPDTILVTNSDGGHGYAPHVFRDIAKALGGGRHEHFWDAYHLNQKVTKFFKPYSQELLAKAFEAIQNHDKRKLQLTLDTVESLVETEEEQDEFVLFSRQLKRQFQYTKPPKLRGLPATGLGVMETQHRKITYRMKKRGMYWSLEGADTMSRLILLAATGELSDLFKGSWREAYEQYKELEGHSAGRANRKEKKVYSLPKRGKKRK